MRADLLVDAWRNEDPAFASMASSIESEFDARRASIKARPKPAKAKDAKDAKEGKGKARPRVKRDVVDGGPADAMGDGGVARAPSERRERDDESDAGIVTDAGTTRSTRERIIGTWLADQEGNVVVVYALCGSGDLVVRYETRGEMHAFDMEPLRGTWEVTEGEPPMFAMLLAGERQEGPVTKLTDDSAEVTFDGESITLTRRSKSANCE